MQTPTPRSLAPMTLVLSALLTVVLPASAFAAGWTVDPDHSEVSFSIDHFFTPVTGAFDDFEISLDYDLENPEKSTVSATIQIASVNTGTERRDNHLLSADWFEADTHPTMTFESTEVKKVSDDQLVAHGTLTIKGESKPVALPITVLGIKDVPEPMQQMFGGATKVASFKAELVLDRNDYGVGVGSWAGTAVVGAEVRLTILIEAHLR